MADITHVVVLMLEVATPATGPPADRGEQITREFAAAADRHRGAH